MQRTIETIEGRLALWEKAAQKQSSSPPTFITTVTTDVWQSIESFLPFEDTISAAQSCRHLQKLIIDVDTRKLKVSHFTRLGDDKYRRKLSDVLNHIHFPSLRRICYPPMGGGRMAVSRNFPVFVRNLSGAINLESLQLCADHIVNAEYQGINGDNEDNLEDYEEDYEDIMIMTLDLLSRNLKNCIKLKELNVDMNGYVDHEVFHSTLLMEALTPIILQRKDDIERLSFEIGGHATDEELEERNDHKIANDFFDAVLSARKKLKYLNINIMQSTGDIEIINSLLKVAEEQVRNGNIHRPALQYLGLYVRREESQQLHYEYPMLLRPIAPLLENLSSCPSIQTIGSLLVPPEFWGEKDSVQVYGNLIKKKNLKTLRLDFFDEKGNFFDERGKWFHGDKVMLTLCDFATYCQSNDDSKIEEVSMASLPDIKASYLHRFTQHLASIGLSLICLDGGILNPNPKEFGIGIGGRGTRARTF